jgi:hypothetical protein
MSFGRWVILAVFSPRGKLLLWRLGKLKIFGAAFILSLNILPVGCFYKMDLAKVNGPNVDLQSLQPIALLPIQDFPGFPESESNLVMPLQDLLARRGCALIQASATSQVLEELDLRPQNLLAAPSSLMKVNERLQAKLFLLGTILEYRVEKSFIRSQEFPLWDVWNGRGYEYRTLPTYHQGTCQMRLRLSLLEADRGSVIWMAEGRVRGPSSSIEALSRKLVQGLLENFPSLLPQP